MLGLLIRITSEKNGNHGASVCCCCGCCYSSKAPHRHNEEGRFGYLNVPRQNVCVFYEDSKIELDLHGNVMYERDRERG